MQIDIAWMARRFALFNDLYFEGKLAAPRFAINRARTRLGSLSYKRRRGQVSWRHPLGASVVCDFTIRLSNYYDQTDEQFADVLLHEMIHYYIAVNGLRDNATHGKLFRSMAERLNAKGHHITVRTDTRNWQTANAEKLAKKRLVLMMKADGNCYLSVINPRYAEAIERQIKRTKRIEGHRWIVTDDPRFEHYSVCRSLRGVRVSADEYQSLANAITLSTAADMPSGFFPPALAK